MRRKKIEAEINSSGWVSADRMANGGGSNVPPSQFNMNPSGVGASPSFPAGPGGVQQPLGGGGMVAAQPIDAWFALEPTGAIHLTIGFTKQAKDRRPFDLGLGRKGAIRQRKEEVHEMYGHKFVSQSFFNIMRCALCGEFIKYTTAMQCEDCKYTCHAKCYPSVVTKCISKSNAETDPDEEKINHRIPHRFEPWSNMSANWCCHCGYILPFGKKNARKCSGKRYLRIVDVSANFSKNVSLLPMPLVCILFRTFVVCQWLLQMSSWMVLGIRSVRLQLNLRWQEGRFDHRRKHNYQKAQFQVLELHIAKTLQDHHDRHHMRLQVRKKHKMLQRLCTSSRHHQIVHKHRIGCHPAMQQLPLLQL